MSYLTLAPILHLIADYVGLAVDLAGIPLAIYGIHLGRRALKDNIDVEGRDSEEKDDLDP